jgi:hypothetical protein
MKIIAQSPFRWTLFEQGREDYVLSVLCERVAQYGVEIPLSAEEIRAFSEQGEASINELADSVYADPERYRDRAIKNFAKQDGWREAIDDWNRRAAERSNGL